MIVALTGGTGFVGRHILAALHRREHEVRLVVRDPSKHGWLKDQNAVEVVTGSLEDAAALARWAQGAQAVIHLVGIIAESGRQTFKHVHVDGTRSVLDAAKAAGVKRFVHMSSLGARPDQGATPYHRTKAAAEELVRASGLSHAILRPSVIAAAGNEVVKMLVGMLRMSPVIPVIGDGQYTIQFVAADDVADAFVTAAEDASITGTFEIAGPEPLTYHQILDRLEAALGVRRRRVSVPVGMVRFSAYAGTALPSLNPITPDQLQMLLEGSETKQNALPGTFHITPRPFADVARVVCAPSAAARG